MKTYSMSKRSSESNSEFSDEKLEKEINAARMRYGTKAATEMFKKKQEDRKKQRDNIKQEIMKKQIEKEMVSAEDRLVDTQQVPGQSGKIIWLVMVGLNVFVILISVGGASFIKYESDRYFDKLSLMDGYDEGNFFSLIFCISMTCTLVSLVGSLILNVAAERARRGRMRYMIYAYVGWTAALCVTLSGTAVMSVAILISVPNVFKDGFFMSMLLYGRIPEIARKVHYLQLDEQCCGSFNYTEWFAVTWSDKVSKIDLNLPKSCCDLLKYSLDDCILGAPFQRLDLLTPWQIGCVPRLEVIFKYLVAVSLGIMVVLFAIEFFLLMMGFVSLPSIKSYETLMIEERIRLMLKRLEIHKKQQAHKETLFNEMLLRGNE